MLKKTLLCLTVLAVVCAGAVMAAPKPGGTLIFGRGGDSVGLDPAYETDGNSFMICDNVLEALVEYKDESTALSRAWPNRPSPRRQDHTFKLRKGVVSTALLSTPMRWFSWAAR
jgi:peptide/nickel transport system substrate-binding protein